MSCPQCGRGTGNNSILCFLSVLWRVLCSIQAECLSSSCYFLYIMKTKTSFFPTRRWHLLKIHLLKCSPSHVSFVQSSVFMGREKDMTRKYPTLYLDDNVVCATWIKILIESLVILSKKLRSTGFQCTDSKVCSLSWVNRMTQKCHWKRRIPWEKCKMHLGSVTLLFCVESWHAF